MKIKQEPSKLKSHIGYQLRLVSNAVSQAFAKKLMNSGVTVAEWVILREMYSEEEKISPSMIAEFTGLTRGAVSKLIERLVNKELVTRSTGEKDRRSQQIKLTSAAKLLVPKLANIADTNDSEFFATLTESERVNLMATLEKLTEIHKLNTTPIK